MVRKIADFIGYSLSEQQIQAKHVVAKFDPFQSSSLGHNYAQSRKNPVSASAMLTGKFLQIRKVFANPEIFCKSRKFLRQVHYWLKNFRILCNTKYPDNMQYDLESFRTI